MPLSGPRLNPRQLRFIEQYMISANAAEAARRAGYSPRSAQQIGINLLTKPHILAAIAREDEARAARTRITADRVLDELARIAFSDLGRILEWGPEGVNLRGDRDLPAADRAAIAEISVTQIKETARARIKLHDKQRALDALAKHLRLYGPTAKTWIDPMKELATAANAKEILRQRIEKLAGEE